LEAQPPQGGFALGCPQIYLPGFARSSRSCCPYARQLKLRATQGKTSLRRLGFQLMGLVKSLFDLSISPEEIYISLTDLHISPGKMHILKREMYIFLEEIYESVSEICKWKRETQSATRSVAALFCARSIAETASPISMNQTHFLPDEAATRDLAQTIGAQLQAGDVVWLSGPLGAGKTTFAQELACALGVHDPVSSPTFVIVNEYHGRLPLLHCDAYRLEGLDAHELADAGLEDFLSRTDAVRLLEWPEMVAHFLPEPDWKIDIGFSDAGKTRKVEVWRVVQKR